VEALCIEMGEVRKVGGVRDSLACATRLPGTLVNLKLTKFELHWKQQGLGFVDTTKCLL
jgi:hypothetical protein